MFKVMYFVSKVFLVTSIVLFGMRMIVPVWQSALLLFTIAIVGLPLVYSKTFNAITVKCNNAFAKVSTEFKK